WSPAEEARIFIATNPQMKRARELKSPALLPAGHYYWRVEGEQGRSLVSSFKLIREVAPEIIRPKNGEQLELKVEVDQAAEVRLQWQGSPQERYMVEWEGEMIPANGTTLLVPAPVAGNYSWRVRIDDAARPLAQWSELQQVTVTLDRKSTRLNSSH